MKRKLLFASLGLLMLCSLSAVIIGAFTGIGPYDVPPAARRLDSEFERSRKLGLPLTQDELIRHIPDDQNAAVALRPVLARKFSSSLSSAATEYYKGVPGSEAKVRALLAEAKPDLDLVVRTTLKDWESELDYDLGPDLYFPHMASIKDLSRALALRAHLSAKADRVSDTLTDLEASRRFSAWLTQEPTLIALLVAIAIDVIGMRGYELAAHQWRTNPAALQKLEASLAKTSQKMNLQRALTGEFYVAVATARNLRQMGGIKKLESVGEDPSPRGAWTPIREGKPSSMMERAFLSSTMKIFNDCFERFNAEGWDDPGIGKSIAESADKEMDQNKVSYIMASIMFPVFSQSSVAVTRRQTIQELTGLLIQARIAKARTGAWPAIKQVDPFGKGEPYRVATSGDTIRIWSVGPKGIDEGGSLTSTKDDDIVVASPR